MTRRAWSKTVATSASFATFALASLASLGAFAAAGGGDDVATQIRSPKVAEHLLAIDAIRRNGAKETEALLKGALKDAD